MNYTALANHSAASIVNYVNTSTALHPAASSDVIATITDVTPSSVVKSGNIPRASFVSLPASPPSPLSSVLSASSSGAAVNNSGSSSFNLLTTDPHELGLLWLPYLIFTVVLLFLIALSFVRFHCQRGDQYRKRQAELEDKPPLSGGPPAGLSGAGTAVNSHPAPRGVTVVPDHMSLFVQFTQAAVTSPIGVSRVSNMRRSSLAGKPNDYQRPITAADHLRQKASSVDGDSRKLVSDVTKKKSKKRAQSAVTSSKRPLLFTFNVNGSMVDIRCGEDERANTFRLNSVGGETVSRAPSATSTAASTAALTAATIATRVVAVNETMPVRHSKRPRDVIKNSLRQQQQLQQQSRDVVKSKRPRDVVAETQMNYYRNQKQLLLFNANNLLGAGPPESTVNATSYRNDSTRMTTPQAQNIQNIRQRERDNVYPTTGRWSGMKRTRDSGSEDEALLQRQRPS